MESCPLCHTMILTVLTKPQPHPRPRAFSRGGAVRIYQPKTDWFNEIRRVAERDWKRPPIQTPVRVLIDIRLKRPKSHYTTKGQLKKSAPKFPISKRSGDLDNFEKTVLDALNGIAYDDDSQVTDLHCYKAYSDKNKTTIEIKH